MSILVTRPSMPSIEEYMEEIRPIFESQFLTNMGPVYKKLQQGLKQYLGVPELSLFVNGHMALEMAMYPIFIVSMVAFLDFWLNGDIFPFIIRYVEKSDFKWRKTTSFCTKRRFSEYEFF